MKQTDNAKVNMLEHTLMTIKIATPGRNADNKMIFIGQIYYTRNKKRINFQEIWVHRLRNQYQKQPPLAVIKALIHMGIESNRDWMACTCKDDHAASTQYHSSSTVVTGVWRRDICSATLDKTFSIGERVGQGDSRTFSRIKDGLYNTGNMQSCIILLKRTVSHDSNKG
ncbi:hypothetical protein TNCV_4839241 [Trichonephila clavipes]|nr:hypothetical protein TNCV_4839241 [Trichonephila clavipes]